MARVTRGIPNLQDVQVDRLFAGSDTAPVRAAINIQPAADPTGTGVEGDLNWNDTANSLTIYDGTQTRKVPDRYVVTHKFNASSVDDIIFEADRAYKILAISEIHTVAGNDAGSVTLDIKKCTGTQAPSAGTTTLTATFNLKSTANTTVAGSLTATAADLLLAAGNRLCADFTGVLTTLAGGCVTIIYEAV